jgi:hypothetical protein
MQLGGVLVAGLDLELMGLSLELLGGEASGPSGLGDQAIWVWARTQGAPLSFDDRKAAVLSTEDEPTGGTRYQEVRDRKQPGTGEKEQTPVEDREAESKGPPREVRTHRGEALAGTHGQSSPAPTR